MSRDAGMQRIVQEMRKIAGRLFEEKRIDLLIGYERGTLPFRSRPFFITAEAVEGSEPDFSGTPKAVSSDPLQRLTWDSFCSNNLAVYIPHSFGRGSGGAGKEGRIRPRIGLVVKGCDMRSVISLIKEKQVPRENLMLIGVPCRGMIDHGLLERLVAGGEVQNCREKDGGMIEVTTRSGELVRFQREKVLQEACRECRHPQPEGVDIRIEGESRRPAGRDYGEVDDFEALSLEERWAIFEAEMHKCIRCYACRQACPNCYCTECFAEQTDPQWIGISTECSDTVIFHLTRILHQAGRCVECDACLRACPMGVNLRLLTRKMVKDVEELFGYVPGFALDEIPPLITFCEDDSEEFITEP